MSDEEYEVALDLSKLEVDDFEEDELEPLTAVPTIDDYEDDAAPPPMAGDYRDFNPADTMVLKGPLANYVFDNPRLNAGKRFATRTSAEQYHRMKHGHVFENIRIPHMWCVRVPKPGKWPPKKLEIK